MPPNSEQFTACPTCGNVRKALSGKKTSPYSADVEEFTGPAKKQPRFDKMPLRAKKYKLERA